MDLKNGPEFHSEFIKFEVPILTDLVFASKALEGGSVLVIFGDFRGWLQEGTFKKCLRRWRVGLFLGINRNLIEGGF